MNCKMTRYNSVYLKPVLSEYNIKYSGTQLLGIYCTYKGSLYAAFINPVMILMVSVLPVTLAVSHIGDIASTLKRIQRYIIKISTNPSVIVHDQRQMQ